MGKAAEHLLFSFSSLSFRSQYQTSSKELLFPWALCNHLCMTWRQSEKGEEVEKLLPKLLSGSSEPQWDNVCA